MKFITLSTKNDGKVSVKADAFTGVATYKKGFSDYTVVYFGNTHIETEETREYILKMLELNYKEER